MSELLSIIIPSYNQGRFLNECIDSILAQDYRPVEIIVVDGASTDETVDILHSRSNMSELRWISEPDGGPADAVNTGLALARGDVAAIQSVDDLYLPGAFSEVMREFASDVSLGLVYGEVQRLDIDGRHRDYSSRPAHDNALCLALCMSIPQSSAFFRPDLARELGGWRSEYYTCDWDLWLRMMFRTRVVKREAVWSARRMYPDQRSAAAGAVLQSYLRMVDESVDIARHPDPAIQRAARASRHLAQVFFNRKSGRLNRVLNLLSATLIFPKVWPHVPRKAEMVFGRFLQTVRR